MSRTGKASFVVYKLRSLWHHVPAAATGAPFAHGCWRLNPGPHVGTANVSQTEPSAQPRPFFF